MINTYTYQGFDFLFDKDFELIGILDEGSVLRQELQDSLEDKFSPLDLIDYLDGTDNNQDYRNKFTDWLEEFTNFIP